MPPPPQNLRGLLTVSFLLLLLMTGARSFGQSLDFAASIDTPATGQSVVFTNTSTGFPVNQVYIWNFREYCGADTSNGYEPFMCNDTTIGTGASPAHAFGQAGYYLVTLHIPGDSIPAVRLIAVGALICHHQTGCELVQNGSFEDYVACPPTPALLGQSTLCQWFNPSVAPVGIATPDSYLNDPACLPPTVPNNPAGCQWGHSLVNPPGNGYAGIHAFIPPGSAFGVGPDYREYIEQQLIAPMVANTTYTISFWVSLAEISSFACDGLGALITAAPVVQPGRTVINQMPQIRALTIVNPGFGDWVQISGNYKATGGERFITIGNFNADNGTQRTPVQFNYCTVLITLNLQVAQTAYYFIDDVSVMPFDEPVITGPCYSCGSNHVYAVSNPLPAPYTYTWQVLSNGVLLASGTGSTTSPVTFPGNVAGQVIFTVSNGPGCSTSSSFEVYPCCEGTTNANTGGILDITDLSASDVINNSGPGGIYENYYTPGNGGNLAFTTGYNGGPSGNSGILSLNGTFTVDQDFRFAHADIKMGPCAQIIIEPNQKLYLTDEVYIHGCGERMWDKIFISDQTSRLIVEAAFVRIEDAETAIISDAGGVYEIGNVTINFNKNWKSIVVKPFQGNHPGYFFHTTFDCEDWPANPGTQATLLPPHANDISDVGVEVNGVGNIDIGRVSPLGSGYDNYFKNLKCGVRSYNSSINVVNNHFENIRYYQGSSPVGYAIWAKGTKVVNGPNYTVKIGGSFAPDEINYFSDCTGAVFTTDFLDLIVENNHFNNLTTNPASPSYNFLSPMIFRNSNANTIIFNGNRMDNFNKGLYLLNTVKSPFTIFNNEFNLSAGVTAISNYAILVENTVNTPNSNPPLMQIISNKIQMCYTGIQATNMNDIQIRSLNTSPPFVQTIRFGGTSVNPWNSGPPFGLNSYGIRLIGGGHHTISQNKITKDGADPLQAFNFSLRGISIERSEINTLVSNNIERLGTAIHIQDVAIPPTTLSCNEMKQPYNGVRLSNANIGNQGDPSQPHNNKWTNGGNIYKDIIGVNPLFQVDWYSISNALPDWPGYFFISPFTPQPPYNNFISNNSGTCLSVPVLNQEDLINIVNENGDFNLLSEDEKYNSKLAVYNQLQRDTTLMYAGTLFDIDLQNFYHNYSTSGAGSFNNAGDSLLNDTSYTAQLISSISPENTSEANEQTVYAIYLVTWAKDIYEFTYEQYQTLKAISIQNPISGGTSVYTARIMLALQVEDFLNDSTGRFSNPILYSFKPFNKGKVYPNPSQGKFTYTIRLHRAEMGIFELFNSFGKCVFSHPLNENQNSVIVEGQNLNSGIYFYRSFANGEKVDSGKIILVRQ